MKIFAPILASTLLFGFGCQPNTASRNAETSTAETASPAPAAPTTAETRQQETVLQQDTLNAVQEEVVKKPTPKAQENFTAFFQNFEAIIKKQDAAAFNQLIDPEHGLYLIDTPGALPQFTHVTDISTFKRADIEQRPFFTIRETFRNCRLEEVKTLPKVTCEGDAAPYEKKGCFVADGSAFRKYNAYQYASLPKEEERKVAQTQLLVNKTVLHTGSGFKFHFGQIKGQWRVLFIDLMTPCSA
ncbi:hypothetical protein [Rufibacter ruber]|uniref:hypothetical protein n=1 Tax=Rufibacter ruber TaxID=1783499 RepID=UPI00082C1C48|nr:hypothetical protein [Rufibacter ruber]